MLPSFDMEVKDKRLFLKYAIPCGKVLVKRGVMSKEKLEELEKKVVKNEKLTQEDVKFFSTALSLCEILAKKMGKKAIDKEVIKKYFLEKHNGIVEEYCKIKRDVNKEECKVKVGKIINKFNGRGIVEAKGKKYEVKLCFVPKAREGDLVSIHYDYACEKL